MRKLFFFRSSGSSNGNTYEKVYQDSCFHDYGEIEEQRRLQDDSQNSNDSSTKRRKQRISGGPGLRRSHSFSSVTSCNHPEWNMNSRGTTRCPISNRSIQQHVDCCVGDYLLMPETLPKSTSMDQVPVLKRVWKLGYSGLSRDYSGSSCKCSYVSSASNKCQTPYLAQESNKVLDRYIDGEQPERHSKDKTDSSLINYLVTQQDDPSKVNRTLLCSQHPPGVQYKEPVAPTNNKDCLRSCSFREVADIELCQSSRDELKPSPRRLAKSVMERLTEVFPQKFKLGADHIGSEMSITREDIFEDYSKVFPCFNSKGLFYNSSTSLDAPQEAATTYCSEVKSTLEKDKLFIRDDPMKIRDEYSYLEREEELDIELQSKGKATEKWVLVLSKELGEEKLTIQNIKDEMFNLAFEVSHQIQSRITERASAREALKNLRVKLGLRINTLEKEKSQVQADLKKELDRRSRDWALKFEKYRREEQRLRERVRELAEKNVSLQREVSSLKSSNAEAGNRTVDLESQLKYVNLRMEETISENCKLQKVVSELQDRSKVAESDQNFIKRSYKEKEMEVKDFHRAVVRLQRVCSEQEKTISGLRQGLVDEISKPSAGKYDALVKLQMEQVRLTGLEQALRKEIELAKVEADSLRHENIALLDRLNGGKSTLFKLEEELRSQFSFFQEKSFLLLNEGSQIFEKLLGFVKMSQIDNGTDKAENAIGGLEGFPIVQYEMKLQSFKREVQNVGRGLRTLTAMMQQRMDLDSSQFPLQGSGGCFFEESEMEHELKAQSLLTKVLQEKLHSQQLELEQLQGDLASSIRCNDILRCETQRAQDAASSLTHKMKDLELQMMQKNNNINQLQMDLNDYTKKLTVTQNILAEVSEERDLMWEEVKQYSEKNMLLNCEVSSLKKKIEVLDEDILFREGQITILKESINKDPFNILYDPSSTRTSLFTGLC